jgi:hypothetical protein
MMSVAPIKHHMQLRDRSTMRAIVPYSYPSCPSCPSDQNGSKKRPSAEPRDLQTLQRHLTMMRMKRTEVPPDGDCFFSCLAHALGQPQPGSASELRATLVRYIRENGDLFASVFETREEFEDGLAAASMDGRWNTDFCDLMPVAACNVFGRDLHIWDWQSKGKGKDGDGEELMVLTRLSVAYEGEDKDKDTACGKTPIRLLRYGMGGDAQLLHFDHLEPVSTSP